MEEKFRPFRHRITILKKIEFQNSFGELLVEWSNFCEIWGELHDNTATVRYVPEVEPGWRVRIAKTEYDITAVIDRPTKTRIVELHLKEIPGRSGFVSGALVVNSSAEGFHQAKG